MQHSDTLEAGDIDTHREVSIIDKDETANKTCHIVDGFVLEDSRQPFPVSALKVKKKMDCQLLVICLLI